MKTDKSRRQFLGAAAAAVASTAVLSGNGTVQAAATPASASRKYPSELYKSRITAQPTDEICEKWKAAGFEGIEVTNWNISVEEARKNRAIAEKHGVRVHSVMRGWANLNEKDPDKLKGEVESIKTALRTASTYGADTILLVPCRVGNLAMPEPWDFDIDFDPATLKVKSVAEGDNAKYAEYIEAQNYATESTARALEALVPVAAKEGIRITVENVWNNLWCTPKYFAAFVKSFDNPWLGCYFDLGNHTKYARCEEWLKELGNAIVKLHIKGFKVNEVKGKLGGGPGDWVTIEKASIDWKAVRKLLAEVNQYSGWVSIEENGHTDEEYSKILDDVFNG